MKNLRSIMMAAADTEKEKKAVENSKYCYSLVLPLMKKRP